MIHIRQYCVILYRNVLLKFFQKIMNVRELNIGNFQNGHVEGEENEYYFNDF